MEFVLLSALGTTDELLRRALYCDDEYYLDRFNDLLFEERKKMAKIDAVVMLDMDGVLVDFVGGLHKALGVPYDYDHYPYEKNKWNMFGDIQRPTGEGSYSFEEIDACCTAEFWENLKWMPDGHDILRVVYEKVKAERIYLLTTPMPNVESASGKVAWIRKNLPGYEKRLIITRASKGILATPNRLLIDDRDKNVDEFADGGGSGIIVPRPWNRCYSIPIQPSKWVEKWVENWISIDR